MNEGSEDGAIRDEGQRLIMEEVTSRGEGLAPQEEVTSRGEGLAPQEETSRGGGLAQEETSRGEGLAQQETSRGGGLARQETSRGGGLAQEETSRGEGLAQQETSRGGGLARQETSRGGGLAQQETSRGEGLAQQEANSQREGLERIDMTGRGGRATVLKEGILEPNDRGFGIGMQRERMRRISCSRPEPLGNLDREGRSRYDGRNDNYITEKSEGRASCSRAETEILPCEIMKKRQYPFHSDICENYHKYEGGKKRKPTPTRYEEVHDVQEYIGSDSDESQRELTREKFKQLDTNGILDKFLNILNKVKSSDKPTLTFNINVIPEFDPMSKEQTVLTWLTKVEECAEIYGWDEKAIIHYALPKLTGVAKTWYQGLPSLLHTWTEWKRKLIESFPCREDYAELLTEMLAKRAKYGESLENYYYSKVNLLNRCKIYGRQAVDCILYGIEDRAVKVGAQAAQFSEPEQVLKYLRTVKVGQSKMADNTLRNERRSSVFKNASVSGEVNNKTRCYNCREIGHPSFKCDKPKIKCTICDKLGHHSTSCFKNRGNIKLSEDKNNIVAKNEKQVAKLGFEENTNSKYIIDIKMNGIKIENCHVDLGSQCTLIRMSVAKRLGLLINNQQDMPTLRGIGSNRVRPLGISVAMVEVQGVREMVDVNVVDDDVLVHPVLLGHSFTERSNIIITKTPDEIIFEKIVNTKVKLLSKDDVTVHSNSFKAISVDTNMEGSGIAYVRGSLRGSEGNEYYLLPGEYDIKNGRGALLVRNMSANPIIITKGDLLVRVLVKDTEIPTDVMNAFTVKFDVTKEMTQLTVNLGFANTTETKIELDDTEPVVYRPYRMSYAERSLVRDMVQEMIDSGIPVSYFSRKTNAYERKLHSYELETLAVFASLNRFRVYLLGIPFKILTDCNAVRSTLVKRDLIPRIARWWIQLQEYDCTIEYRQGVQMAHVDALSRNPIDENETSSHILDVLEVHSTVQDWLSTVQSADDEILGIKEILKDPQTAQNDKTLFWYTTQLITDKGSTFTSKAFKDFVISYNIKHVINAVSTPRANGQVERFNRTILNALSTSSHGDDEKAWDEHILDIQIGINTTKHKTLQKSVSELLFGFNIKGRTEGILSSVIDDTLETPVNKVNTFRSEANEKIKIQQSKDAGRYNKARKPITYYKEGDLVRVERQTPHDGKSQKLVNKYQGPYRVIKIGTS
ncbi:uncharacterized protein LOC123693263 [Colias croceus]|uniref:uncharacterized protein LOC123693263 n=1 Tax=Colias crocea TaxID=72248 RepID=UPI001E279EEF|nr:uncharacterized protein LOC123693263 [Colias croceus]